jgi:tellurite resistance protein TehA-like permease
LFEAVLFVITEINDLSLINVSEGYLNGGEANASYYQNLGSSIQAENLWIFLFYVLIFTLGGLIFYSALYKSRVVPRFLSVWGLIAAALLLVGTMLVMVELNTGPLENVWELITAVPIAVNEMVLALWLIIKGFRQPGATNAPA